MEQGEKERREGSIREAIGGVATVALGGWVILSVLTLVPFIGTFGNPPSDTLLERVTNFVWGANILVAILLGIGFGLAAIVGYYRRVLRGEPHKPQR